MESVRILAATDRWLATQTVTGKKEMGTWSKSGFGVSELPSMAIIFGGGNPLDIEDRIVGFFDRIIEKRHGVYHAYVVRKGQKDCTLLFQVYGPAVAVDCLHILHDGGCKEMVFIGYAWCRAEAAVVGDYILPSKTLLLDGFTNAFAPHTKWAKTDVSLQSKIERATRRLKTPIHRGVTVSIPSVFRKPKGYGETLKRVRGIAHEMELGSLLFFSKKLKIHSAGALIVSDTPHQKLYGAESERARTDALIRLSSEVVDILI